MDVFEQEGRLIQTGFEPEQAREIVRMVASGDSQAMTRADGEKLERALRSEMEQMGAALRQETQSLGRELRAEMKAMSSRQIATSWTVGGVLAGILLAAKFLG